MDGAGVLYDSKDPIDVATLMDGVLSDVTVQEDIVRAQLGALERLKLKNFGEMLLGFVETSRAAAAVR